MKGGLDRSSWSSQLIETRALIKPKSFPHGKKQQQASHSTCRQFNTNKNWIYTGTWKEKQNQQKIYTSLTKTIDDYFLEYMTINSHSSTQRRNVSTLQWPNSTKSYSASLVSILIILTSPTESLADVTNDIDMKQNNRI